MPRRNRPSNRPPIHEKPHHHKPRKDRKPARGCRSSSVPHKPSGKQRHDRLTRRIAIDVDTDGDCTMLPTPPASPETLPPTCTPAHKDGTINTGVAGSHNRTSNPGRCVSLRSLRVSPGGSSTVAQQFPGDATLKNFRFRHYLLSVLEQQRAAVELWADSVGAGGPAEPMDWQPEQERVVYIARDPAEYGCYGDRWRMDLVVPEGQQQQQGVLAMVATSTPVMVRPELGSWAGDTRLDGPTVPAGWGDSATGSCFLDEIE
ncbi:hypothetical protein LY78DRAFT_326789 [Colletotrichum sublineola]|uniref:Uncharacterized protein n=1 Tax=Colletotrichum sublineola TaxID=1173701 RepID=A0A066XWV7_COLSU|nr:hypothetical protein LY78DRAFT_326789 [Colletotrichum sublineola]KDN70246.1 hypothetical protein CSUB01_03476 [Colletotrichum sublineola]